MAPVHSDPLYIGESEWCVWICVMVASGVDEFLRHNTTNSLFIFLMLLGNKPSESEKGTIENVLWNHKNCCQCVL